MTPRVVAAEIRSQTDDDPRFCAHPPPLRGIMLPER
jgi:hypothetical protein